MIVPPPPPVTAPPANPLIVPAPPATADPAAATALIVGGDHLAEIFDVTPRRIQQLTNQGIVVKVARGKYDQNESTTNYIRFWRNVADGKGYDDNKGTSKAQLEKARAKKATIEANVAEQSVLPVVDVQIMLNETMVLIATQMDGLPGRLCSELAAMDNAAEIRIKLLDEMRKIRTAAASRLTDLGTVETSGTNINAATEPDNGPMGKSE